MIKIRRFKIKSLQTAIDESLAHDMGPEEYNKEIQKKASGKIIEQDALKAGEVYHNPPEEEHTSDREAYGKITWIEYWRRLIGFKGNHLKCSFCGEDIFIIAVR